jgi:hypothetical protein
VNRAWHGVEYLQFTSRDSINRMGSSAWDSAWDKYEEALVGSQKCLVGGNF